MAPGPRKSDAIDKPDPRAPHIILRTLPALSFSTPTHSVHVQLAFRPPARDKLCPMAETTVDPRSISGSAFGGASTPVDHIITRSSTPHSSGTRASIDLPTLQTVVEDLKRNQVTRSDLQGLSRQVNDRLDTHVTASRAFEKRTNEKFVQLEKKLDNNTSYLEGRINNAIRSLQGKMDHDRDRANERFDNIDRSIEAINTNVLQLTAAITKLTNGQIQIEPVQPRPSPVRPATPPGPPLVFVSPETPSPPDSITDAPYKPPSPPSLSPTSPTSRSTRSLRSRSSMVSLAESVGRRVGNRVRSIFQRAAAEAERGAMEEADSAWNERSRDIPPVPPLPQSPQEDQPVAGPSTQSPRAPSSKEKLRLVVGQPIQRDRHE